MGQRREQVEKIPVGNVVAIEGLKNLKSGETLVNKDFIANMVAFENVKYVSTPVITVSIEPEYLRDLDQMKEIIENLLIEDPNLQFEINKENGEFLLSGMGPLHLEVTASDIERRGVEVSISEPRAVFKESLKAKSSMIKVKSTDGKSTLELKIERIDDKTNRFFQNEDYRSIKPRERLMEVLKERTNLSETEIENFWISDSDQNLLIFQDYTELSEIYKDQILEIIQKIQMNGPLSGEKLTEVKIVVDKLDISNLGEEEAYTELSTMFYNAIKKGLKEGDIILMEPIYHTIIQLPPEYIKSTLSLMPKYSIKVKNIDQEKDYQAIIEIFLPVRNSVNFAEDIRSISSGRAFWQNEFYAFVEVPPQEATTIISNLRFSKGLSW